MIAWISLALVMPLTYARTSSMPVGPLVLLETVNRRRCF
jgi:hypothetical protein